MISTQVVSLKDFNAADPRADKLEELLRAVVNGWRDDMTPPEDAPELWRAVNAAEDYLRRLDVNRATAAEEKRRSRI